MSQSIDKVIPESHFPDTLDDNTNLFHVFNTSESKLDRNFGIDDDIIYIEPRSWDDPEKWYFYGGLINIEGEVVYYKEVEYEEHPNPPVVSGIRFFDDPNVSDEDKDSYRRVTAFKNLVRNADQARTHLKGEWARGYVMSEHHNALRNAISGAETLIGIDNSLDHTSIDYRLRDLQELNPEKDDINCPYGVYWYEITNDPEKDNGNKNVTFHISIIGDYETFEFVPEPGADPIIDDLNPTWEYSSGEEIGASLTVHRGDCCACISENSVPCEPCEFDGALLDIPILNCPEIIIPELPNPCPECEVCTIVECTPCTTTSCPTGQDTTVISTFTYNINITIPPIVITAPTAFASATAYINWEPPDSGTGEGACFKLVPCQGTTS